MSIYHETLGLSQEGKPYERYTLIDKMTGGFVCVLNYGCTLQKIVVPDRDGNLVDVALGYDTPDEYANTKSIFGTILGRYANRIAGGKFSIDGKEYQVTVTDKRSGNSLHGGANGFNTKMFDSRVEGDEVVLTYVSEDGEEGYPGTLTVTERVSFIDGKLRLRYSCTTDKDTVANISNHSFFNLDGQGNGSTLEQTLKLNCSYVCPGDEGGIPTGELRQVEGTRFDFLEGKKMGADINSDDPFRGGYDNCFAINDWTGNMRQAAEVSSEKNGIVMKVITTLPAMQFFTAGILGIIPFLKSGKQGAEYAPFGAFCLETQNFPNAMNTPSFNNDVILRAGDVVESETIYEFSTK